MQNRNVLEILVFVLTVSVDLHHCQEPSESMSFSLNEAFKRHARFRCLQQFPHADILNYTDTLETQCFLHCFLYRSGLMDLSTRGLHSEKFIGIWNKLDEPLEEDNCLERFAFCEPLNGKCSDSYRKLMEFREKCPELFQNIFTFTSRNIWSSEDHSKSIGKSATEFCDSIESEDVAAKENLQDIEASFLTQYQDKLKCIFENLHYLDAYGRVDEFEINLSYHEANVDSQESRAIVRTCCHRANAKFQTGYLGNVVLELQKCLQHESRDYSRVFELRDEASKQY